MTRALAYVRRSRVYADRPGAISEQQQIDTVRELAARHGYTLGDGDILRDWGKSGGAGKEEQRGAYQSMRDAIRSGAVAAVVCFDLSRLTRSIGEWADLAADCAEHGVVILAGDQTFDFRGWQGKMVANILASVAEGQRDRDREKGRDLIARRRARGDTLGAPAYGSREEQDAADVIEAFREAGTYQGAARLLTARGVAPMSATWGRPDAVWRASSVRRILRRTAPGEVPAGTRRGAPAVGRHRLASLLTCSCGGLLTGQSNRRSVTIYRCSRAYTVPGHSRPYSISEAAVLPAVLAELEHLHPPADRFPHAGDAQRERAAIRAERERLAFGYARGAIDHDAYLAADVALTERLAGLEAAAAPIVLPPRDAPLEAAPPEVLNTLLRKVFARIDLGPDMTPVGFTWRVPEWRA